MVVSTRVAIFGLTVLTSAGYLATEGVAAARAWSTENSVRAGCHEEMTVAGIEAAGGWGEQSPLIAPEHEPLERDIPYSLPADARDYWTLVAVIGNRHADLQGHETTDFPALSYEAALPDAQAQHCLRAPDEDGTDGDMEALRACRDYIFDQIDQAIQDDGSPRLDLTTVKVSLTFRGPTDVQLPTFPFRVGLALHTVQDGFSHTFRAHGDMHHPTHVLNYVDLVSAEGYDEAVDGYRHLSHLDDCEATDGRQQLRYAFGTQASADSVAAVIRPATSRAERMDRVREVLDRWFTLQSGCDASNGWCDAEEIATTPSGCDAGGMSGSPAPWVLGALTALLLWSRRRRSLSQANHRSRTSRALSRLWVQRLLALALAVGVWSTSGLASAQDEYGTAPGASGVDESSAGAEDGVAPDDATVADAEVRDQIVEAESDGAEVVAVDREDDELEIVERRTVDAVDLGEPINRGFGMYLGGGLSLDNASGIVQLGVRLDTTSWLTLGLDFEYNPWFSLTTGEGRPGTLNFALAGIVRWGVVGPVEIRTTAHVGMSYLMFSLVQADAGSIGPFVGGSPLGIAVRLGRMFRFVFDPGGIYLSVPNTAGIPLIHVQHRFTVGVQFNP